MKPGDLDSLIGPGPVRAVDLDGTQYQAAIARVRRELPADAQSLIKDRICPFCRAGPFRALGSHAKKHGVPAFLLRDAAGLPRTTQLMDDDVRQRMAVLAVERDPLPKRSPDLAAQPRKVTKTGKANIRQGRAAYTVRAEFNLDSEDRAELIKVARQLKTARQRVEALLDERAALIVRLHSEGTPVSLIARCLGLTRPTVHYVIRTASAGEES